MGHDILDNFPQKNLVVLGLGSNLGDSAQIINSALQKLRLFLSDSKSASLYQSDPMYVTDQNFFINTVISGFYSDSPEELLGLVNKIEEFFGRNRSTERRWGERFLDIDILLFGGLIVNMPNLQIPHPRIKERRFVLEPLLEILSDATEPGTGVLYRDIRETLLYQKVNRI